MRSFRHPRWQHLDYRVKVATTQENKPPTQGTRQWIFTTPRWRCGSILLPSLNAGVPEPTGGTLRPRQNGRHFADDIFKCIFLKEDIWIPKKISLKFVPKGPINNIPALVQIMAWRRPGDKPLSEPMMVSVTTHICVTRPQWVHVSRECAHKTNMGISGVINVLVWYGSRLHEH